MLWLAVIFLLIALLAYFMGAGQVEGMAILLAKWCFVAFIVLLILGFIFSHMGSGPGWGWPGGW